MGFLGSVISLSADAGATVATQAVEETGRLFGLDVQTLFDAAVTAVNVFLLFIFLSYILFNPVRDMLKKRQDKITSDRETAKADVESATALKEEYEEKLKKVDKEAEAILSEARKKATQREQRMIDDAKLEATRIIEHANAEANLEKKRVIDEVKQEIIAVAAIMAGKVVSQSMDTKVSDALLEETLNEMGDSTWLS